MQYNENEIVDGLQKVGFRENDAKVYYTLVRLGIAKMVDLTESTKIQRPRVYDSLDRLEKLGLILKDTIQPTPRYRALSPKSVFMLMQTDFNEKIRLLEALKAQLLKYKTVPPKNEFSAFKFEIPQITHYAGDIINNSKGEVQIVIPTFQIEAFSSIINTILESFSDQANQFTLIMPHKLLQIQKMKTKLLENTHAFLCPPMDEIPFGLISNETSQALQIFPSDCIFISNIDIIPTLNSYVRILQKLASPVSAEEIERAAKFKMDSE
jgi:sugar-specific transcriptional regulator TrmB